MRLHAAQLLRRDRPCLDYHKHGSPLSFLHLMLSMPDPVASSPYRRPACAFSTSLLAGETAHLAQVQETPPSVAPLASKEEEEDVVTPPPTLHVQDVFTKPFPITKSQRGHAAAAVRLKSEMAPRQRRLQDLSFGDWTLLQEEQVLIKGYLHPTLLRRFQNTDLPLLLRAFSSGLPLQLTVALYHYFVRQNVVKRLSTGALLVFLERVVKSPLYRDDVAFHTALADLVVARLPHFHSSNIRRRMLTALVALKLPFHSAEVLHFIWERRVASAKDLGAPTVQSLWYEQNEYMRAMYHTILSFLSIQRLKRAMRVVNEVYTLRGRLHPHLVRVLLATVEVAEVEPDRQAQWRILLHRVTLSKTQNVQLDADTYNQLYALCARLQRPSLALSIFMDHAEVPVTKSVKDAEAIAQTLQRKTLLGSHGTQVIASCVSSGAWQPALSVLRILRDQRVKFGNSIYHHLIAAMIVAGQYRRALFTMHPLESTGRADLHTAVLRLLLEEKANVSEDKTGLAEKAWQVLTATLTDPSGLVTTVRTQPAALAALMALVGHHPSARVVAERLASWQKALWQAIGPNTLLPTQIVHAFLRHLFRVNGSAAAIAFWLTLSPIRQRAAMDTSITLLLLEICAAFRRPSLCLPLLNPLPLSAVYPLSKTEVAAICEALLPTAEETQPVDAYVTSLFYFAQLHPSIKQDPYTLSKVLSLAARSLAVSSPGVACEALFDRLTLAGFAADHWAYEQLAYAFAVEGASEQVQRVANASPEASLVVMKRLLLLAATRHPDEPARGAAVASAWSQLKEEERDVASYTLMLQHAVHVQDMTHFTALLREMRDAGIEPTSKTLGVAMQMYAKQGDVRTVADFVHRELALRPDGESARISASVQHVLKKLAEEATTVTTTPLEEEEKDSDTLISPLMRHIERQRATSDDVEYKLTAFLESLRQARASSDLLIEAFALLFPRPTSAHLNILCTHLAQLARETVDLSTITEETRVSALQAAISLLREMQGSGVYIHDGTWGSVIGACRQCRLHSRYRASGVHLENLRRTTLYNHE